MLEMNKVMLIGNLTRNPEQAMLQNGTELAKLGIALNRRWKNAQGEQQEEVAYVDIDAWKTTAAFCNKYLKKGTRVYVEGSLKYESWTDKDGSKRNRLKVTADRVQFALPKAEGPSKEARSQETQGYMPPSARGHGYAPPPTAPPAPPPAPAPATNTSDDLPF